MADRLDLGAGQRLVDLGCGRGGPGMWVAQRSGAVMAVDVLQLVDDHQAFLAEAARLLRPGGRLALTTWEGAPPAPARFPRDLAGLVVRAGLRLDAIVDRPDWLARQLRIYRAAATAGRADPAIADLADEGRQWQAYAAHTRRVLLTAHRPTFSGRSEDVLARVPAALSLHGRRVRLEPLRADHAEELAPLLDDPSLHTFTGGRPATPAELRDRYRRQSAGWSPDGTQRWLNWVVRHRSDGRALGLVQATVTADPTGCIAEVAWTTLPAHQRHGYATDAAQLMVSWLLLHGAHCIVAHIHPDHHASRAVAQHLGLSPTPTIQAGEVRWQIPPDLPVFMGTPPPG